MIKLLQVRQHLPDWRICMWKAQHQICHLAIHDTFMKLGVNVDFLWTWETRNYQVWMGPSILLAKIWTAGGVLVFLVMQLKTSRVLNDRQHNPLQQNAWPRLKDLMWQPWWHTHSSLRRLGRKWSSDLKYVFLNIFPLSHLAFCLTMSHGKGKKNALTTAVTDIVRGVL